MRAAHLTPEALVGRVVGERYRVIQLLGSGGTGHVYLAELIEPPPSSRPGAQIPLRERPRRAEPRPRLCVKVLRAEHRSRPDLVARFEREAVAAARVRHPNVLEVMSAPIFRDGIRCFAMELLVGLDLADTLAFARQLNPVRALRITASVAEGLGAAHAAGVIHRDVKPENIFLVHAPDGREKVKLLDFGFAFLPGDPAEASPKVVGTPEYMAPEQASGAPAHPGADIYSLGIVLYEMLAGRAPFSGEYPAIAFRHAQDPPPPLRGPALPGGLEGVVRRAIAKAPGDRFASMEEFHRALVGLL